MPVIAFSHRRLEWWLAGFTLFWGVGVTAAPGALSSDAYVVLNEWASSTVWGVAAAITGMFHLWALFINGRRSWSPFIRVAATIGNTAIFTIVLGAILSAMQLGLTPVTEIAIIHIGPVSAGVVAFWVAARDARYIIVVMRVQEK